jgi:hypothetical protein
MKIKINFLFWQSKLIYNTYEILYWCCNRLADKHTRITQKVDELIKEYEK